MKRLHSCYGLAGVLAYSSTGGGGYRSAGRDRLSDRLLDRLFEMALEIYHRSDRRFAHRSPSNRAWILCLGRARRTQSARAPLASHDRTHSGVHVSRLGDRLGAVQFAVCRAAVRVIARIGGFAAVAGIRGAGSYEMADLLASAGSAFDFGLNHGNRSQLRPHDGRIWRRAHGRGQYPRRDADALDQYL